MPVNNQIALKRRRSIRLSGYDYSRGGYYFVTLTLKTIACMFACRSKNRLILTDVGKIAEKYWNEIPNHFQNAKLDKYVFMPDHSHGILVLDNNVGVQYIEPVPQSKTQKNQRHEYQHIIPKSIGSIIRSYKSAVTRWCKKNGYPQFRWHRNYYERIIRNEDELNEIRKYIITNPEKLNEH